MQLKAPEEKGGGGGRAPGGDVSVDHVGVIMVQSVVQFLFVFILQLALI